MNKIVENIRQLKLELGENVILIAVTKYTQTEQMKALFESGHIQVGENKVQDILEKQQIFPSPSIEWHMIGRLQSNKVKKAVASCYCIQSVDSLKLTQLISREAQAIGKTQNILLQINLAEDLTKAGFSKADFKQNETEIFSLPNLKIMGIMLIAPHTEDEHTLTSFFTASRQFFDDLVKRHPTLETLSMGMSHDYKLAVAQGATMVRIGSRIFN